MLTDENARAIADSVLRPILGPVGFEAAEVRSDVDFAGDDVLYVTARFRAGTRVTSSVDSLHAAVTLQQAFEASGDARLAHLRYYYPDTSRPIDDKPRDEAA